MTSVAWVCALARGRAAPEGRSVGGLYLPTTLPLLPLLLAHLLALGWGAPVVGQVIPLEAFRSVSHGVPLQVTVGGGGLDLRPATGTGVLPCARDHPQASRCREYAAVEATLGWPRRRVARVTAHIPDGVWLWVNEVRAGEVPGSLEVCLHRVFRPLEAVVGGMVVYPVDLGAPCDEVVRHNAGGPPPGVVGALQLMFTPTSPTPAEIQVRRVELADDLTFTLDPGAGGVLLPAGRPLAERVGVLLGPVHTAAAEGVDIERTISHLDASDLERVRRLGVRAVRTGQGWSGYEVHRDGVTEGWRDEPTREFFARLRGWVREEGPVRVVWGLMGHEAFYASRCSPWPRPSTCGDGVRQRFEEECDDALAASPNHPLCRDCRLAHPWPPPAPDPLACRSYADAYLKYVRHHAALVHQLAGSEVEVVFLPWNEANLHPFWRPGTSPEGAAALLAETLVVLAEVAPGRAVVAGSFTHEDSRPDVDLAYLERWADALDRGGVRPSLVAYHWYRPWWAFHNTSQNPHAGPQPETITDDLRTGRGFFTSRGWSTELVDTEWGLSSVLFDPQDGHSSAARQRQAVATQRRILVAAVAGFDLSVLFKVRDSALLLCERPGGRENCRCFSEGCELPAGRARNPEWNFGLYDELGELKPAGAAVAALLRQVGWATQLEVIPTGVPYLHLLRFRGPRRPAVLALWSSADSAPGHTFPVPREVVVVVPPGVQLLDLWGNPRGGAGSRVEVRADDGVIFFHPVVRPPRRGALRP